MTFWRWTHAAVLAWVATTGFSLQAKPLFHAVQYAGRPGGDPVTALVRDPIAQPLRYRVIVIPGSGCTGMRSVADRYFAGLLHAQVLFLHKPGVDINAGLAPEQCPPEFVATDSLSEWLATAKSVLRQDASARQGGQPVAQLLVGISEGAELLVDLAAEVPDLMGLVLVSAPGLDPAQVGEAQAIRLGQLPAWGELNKAQLSNLSGDTVVQGRTLRYWRDLWGWTQSQRLIDSPWPILQVWGERDALIPKESFEAFATNAASRSSPWCSRSFADANHGLQSDAVDGIKWLWTVLDIWGKDPSRGLCHWQ